MTHQEFVTAYRHGSIELHIDREAAAKVVSGRLLLPLVLLPFLGLAVALAIGGYWMAGAALFAAVLLFRYAVRASARGFVLARSLNDPRFFEDALAQGIVRIVPISGDAGREPAMR